MRWGKIVRIFGSILLLVLLAWKLDWDDLGALIVHCDPFYLLGAAVLTQVLVFTLSVRLYYMVLPYGLAPSFRTVCRITWVGQFFNSCLPGSTGGDIYKIYEMCRLNPSQHPTAAAAIVADRIFALLALLVLAACGALTGELPWEKLISGAVISTNTVVYAVVALVSLLVVLVACLICSMRLRRYIVGFVAVCVATSRQTLRYFCSLKRVTVVLLLAMFGFLTLFGAIYLMAQSLGISMTYLQVMAIMPVLMLLVLLPVTVNGHGLREVILIGFFSWLKLNVTDSGFGPKECAVAFSLLMVANDLVSVVPGGYLYFFGQRVDKDKTL